MPELPDIVVYVEALRERVVGRPLAALAIRSPAILRTWDPRPEELAGRTVASVHRIGKRVAFGLEGDLHAVVHLMIAGRFHWKKAGARATGRNDQAAFAFEHGTLMLTEASQQKRAALHLVRGAASLDAFDRGGLDVLAADLPAFDAALRRENHTVKRALTDPAIFDGIGNAYSDEILLAARLSPMTWTTRLAPEAVERLYAAARDVLVRATATLRAERGTAFPEKVTAFRPEFGAHGQYGRPCPQCGTPIQRITYASNETNYCPTCQTEGKLLADRAMSRLLRGDWPKTLDELEALKERQAFQPGRP